MAYYDSPALLHTLTCSYHVNGLESPLRRLVRGGLADSTSETVFAGDGDSAGTTAEPFVLTWRPNA